MPAGLLYEPDFISPEEERALLAGIATLRLEEAKYKSYIARRRIAAFGSSYDFDAKALVTEYRPGTLLGWHRDVPDFDMVAGVSLAGRCRMRFRPYPPKPRTKAFVLELEPRSLYLLRDEIRWRWQHSVAPTRELRYSVTFRTRRAKR